MPQVSTIEDSTAIIFTRLPDHCSQIQRGPQAVFKAHAFLNDRLAIDNEFFSIKPYTPVFSTAEYDFLSLAIWIRVYKLPLRAMNRDMGLRLGGCVGTALGVDHRVEGGNMGEFLRILVQVDIRKPLRRCVLLNNGLGKQASPCPLRYERLPDFCYFRGLVGHVLSTCTVKPPTEDGKKLQLQYGSPVSTEPTTGAETNSPGSLPPNTDPPEDPCVDTTTATAEVDTVKTAEDTAAAAPPSKTVEDTAAAATPSKTVEDALVSAEVVASKMLPPDPASPNDSVPEFAKVDHCLTNVNVYVSPRVSKRTLRWDEQLNLFDGGCWATPSSVMKMVCWNFRGLENSTTVQFLSDFVAHNNPALVFLCETRLKQSSSVRIKSSLNMDRCLTVDFGSGCNGLMLLWNNEIKVTLLSYSMVHIDVIVEYSLEVSDLGSYRPSSLSFGVTVACRGDFNEILCHSEKEGGRRKLPGFLENFSSCLHCNGLSDCLTVRGWFTWLYTNGSIGDVIQERLDRFVALQAWLSRFPEFRVTTTFTATSEHCILLHDALPVAGTDRRHACGDYFRFKDCWSKESACIDRVRSAWMGTTGSTISKFRLLEEPIAERDKAAFLDAKREQKALLDKEESYWAQHKHAEVAGVVTRYFTTLFASSQPTPHASLLSDIIPCIDSTMNESLMRPFTNDEILSAFQDINPRKAPALIPKFAEPVRMKQLRPISLCTTIYKIVSKTLLNRMKPFLHLFISENQSAFLKGHLISDNILIAHELIHYLSSSKNGPNKGVALKLDMDKAFDRVEWTFLRSVMLRVGFHPDWVALIMDCFTTITFFAWVNGRLTTEFTPQRGLRQGDLLSSFLFLLCMQGLSAALQAEQEAGNIKGIRASQQGPRINHLFYVDDNIIFVRNFVQEFTYLKEVFRIFADSLGQRINFDKSTVFFSPSTTAAHRQRLLSTLPLSKVFDPRIYLGAPLKVGKNKTNVFNYINEKVDKCIDRWTKRLLSFGGREIFLKSVAQALPQYIMSCYLLPRIITYRITSSMRRYWWTGKANERGWALMAWDKICTPKNACGLGLQDLRCFNLALLGKQLWRLHTRPESLVAIVYRAKYFPAGSLLDALIRDHSSFAWKGLHVALQELRPDLSLKALATQFISCSHIYQDPTMQATGIKALFGGTNQKRIQ
ncbi:hypothetical protein GQ457_09G015610 [Hibiscus cannabinus]